MGCTNPQVLPSHPFADLVPNIVPSKILMVVLSIITSSFAVRSSSNLCLPIHTRPRDSSMVMDWNTDHLRFKYNILSS